MNRFNPRSPIFNIGFSLTPLSASLLVLGSDKHRASDAAEASATAAPGAAPTQEAQMNAGLDLLYKSKNPSAAADAFREVRKMNPNHYGARFQLAKALDASGKPEEARPLWQEV